jgi:uncharacterized membrane protein
MRSILRLHPRLLAATLIGIVVFIVARDARSTLAAGIVAWNAGCWSWIAMMGWLMAREDARGRHEVQAPEDIAAWLVLVLICIASVVSIAAIVYELSQAHDAAQPSGRLHYLLAGVTVAGSWLAVGIAFATHYAHLYYAADAARRPLRFPEEGAVPDFADFLYFAFTIAVAAQTSDVSVVSTDMRKVVVAHSVLGFLFNVAIIGFSINVFAGAVGR